HDRALTQLKAQLHTLPLHGGAAGEGAERQPLPAAAAEGPDRQPASASARSRQVERELDYLQFENRFRGSQEDVAGRQSAYVDLFRELPAGVVDLGCGRGEFLELLKGAGIAAYGLDMSEAMVSVCRERGLDARQGDLLEHLATVPEGSVGGVFCAQVLEHLDPSGVVRFFELAWLALRE